MNTLANTPSQFAKSAQGTTLTDPMAVIREPTLGIAEKRAVLASWASDQHAVPDHPALRSLDSGSLVRIDDILDALKTLDQMKDDPDTSRKGLRSCLYGDWPTQGRLARWSDNDDDPPTPAPAAVRPRPPVLEGGVVAVAAAA